MAFKLLLLCFAAAVLSVSSHSNKNKQVCGRRKAKRPHVPTVPTTTTTTTASVVVNPTGDGDKSSGGGNGGKQTGKISVLILYIYRQRLIMYPSST